MSPNASMKTVLVITDGSVEIAGLDRWNATIIKYRFTDKPSPDGFSCWWSDATTLSVSLSARSLVGGFRQQAMNRLILQCALKLRIHAVVIVGFYGCTLDLPRIMGFLHVPVGWIFQSETEDLLLQQDRFTFPWVSDSLRHCQLILGIPPSIENSAEAEKIVVDGESFNNKLDRLVTEQEALRQVKGYDYSLYEFGLRDHPLLHAMQEPDIRHFSSCGHVVDIGCGTGIFVSLLNAAGIPAKGIERNSTIAAYGRGMGLDIVTADAVDFIVSTEQQFDGVYCSHFVEHLPIHLVETLIENLARITSDNGVVVLTFPDPESIRSQLLGFWRDPEHVRFYHPELIISLANAVDLELEWSSYEDQPHDVVPFPLNPDPLVVSPSESDGMVESDLVEKKSFFERLLNRLFPSIKDMQHRLHTQQSLLQQQQQIIDQLAQRTETLWSVNKTWAWNDNVTLKFRRRRR